MPMYARGTQAKALCMRCGLQFLLPELVNDGYFPNIRVCTDCYDPPQPQEKLAIVSDPEGLWKPSPDTYVVTAPLLNIQVLGLDVALNWSGFNVHGPELTAGYLVQRSPTGLAAWTTIATLANTADEFGAMSVETNTYIDQPGAGTWDYQVFGYDVLFNSEYGA